jgi:DNA repair protein RadC
MADTRHRGEYTAGDVRDRTPAALAPDDRPREKLVRVGADALGDNELVALVLGTGQRDRTALELANALLGAVGGLHRLTRTTHDGLCVVPGVGAAQAARLLAAVELGRRTLLQPPGERPQLRSPRETAAFLLPRFSARPVEHFGVVLLDVRCRVLRVALLSVGTIDATTVHPREVFREAAAAGASSVVLFHNHPSGDPAPSPDDARLTARLVRAGEVMGIDVIDHLILADHRYYSFRESGGLTAIDP